MYHTVEFNHNLMLDIEISPQQYLEKVAVQRGSRTLAQVRPYVVETIEGPVEVADLFFSDGTVTRMLSFACFQFVD